MFVTFYAFLPSQMYFVLLMSRLFAFSVYMCSECVIEFFFFREESQLSAARHLLLHLATICIFHSLCPSLACMKAVSLLSVIAHSAG